MCKVNFIYILLIMVISLTAKTARISYTEGIIGKSDENSPLTILLTDGKFAELYSDESAKKLRDCIPVEKSYFNYSSKKIIETVLLRGKERIFYQTDFDTAGNRGITDDKMEILGFACHKIRRVINSNTIDIFYTEKAGVSGSPRLSFASIPGLILKIVINNNYEIRVIKIDWLDADVSLPNDLGRKVTNKEYDKLVTESLVTNISVFHKERISFGNKIENPTDSSSNETFHYSGGTVILKKVQLPEAENDDQIFVELTARSKGDAYDRSGSVFIIPTERKQSFLDGLKNGITALPAFQAKNGKNYQGNIITPDYLPLCEIMRFYTPFGVSWFNNKIKIDNFTWQDSVLYKEEVTYLKAILQGEVLIGTFIGNYDQGGHEVSLNFKYHPGSRETVEFPAKKGFVLPLFNTLNAMEMSGQEYGTMFDKDSLTLEFDIPDNVENLKMYYISTGHGGWGGGDEFNQKLNEIFIDGNLAYATIPWRTDCGVYRTSNPASGNFWNGLSSSDLSRSGWCPGTVTKPEVVALKNIKPGRHIMKIAIPIGEPEGGSFSGWNISGVITGNYR